MLHLCTNPDSDCEQYIDGLHGAWGEILHQLIDSTLMELEEMSDE
jgi:hypothetical protein